MQHTEHELAKFEEIYSKRRRYQNLLTVVLLPFVLGMRYSINPEAGTVLGLPLRIGLPLVLLLMFSGVVLSLRNWRCPACEKYLGGAFRGPRHCPNCGVKLRP